MSSAGPTSQPPAQAPSPAIERANRMSAANMLRSLAPLVVICLALAGWMAFQQSEADTIPEVDPTTTLQLAAARAAYPVVAPTDLPEGYTVTYARTDAGEAEAGDPVTLEIGHVTPSGEFAGFVLSDDAGAAAVDDVLAGVQEQGTVELGGRDWTRGTTQRGETVLSCTADDATVLVTGSATDTELETVAAAVRSYSG